MDNSDNRIIVTLGPLQVDVPQSLGYFGGIAAAVAFGVLEPPLAGFIAAIPVLKMLANPAAPQPLRFVGELLQGAAKPLGSDGEGTIELADPDRAWRDVKRLAQPTHKQPEHSTQGAAVPA